MNGYTPGPPSAAVNGRELPRNCRGDRNAFAQLMNAYQAPVHGYLVRCGVPAASRDDVFQEIFVKIHLAAASYRPSRPLRPWLFTIVANSARNHLRDEGRRRTRMSLAKAPAEHVAGTGDTS